LRRYCDLSAADLVGIAHGVNVQHRFHREVAGEFGVSVGLVSRVGRKARCDVIEKRFSKEESKVADSKRIVNIVGKIIEQDRFVASTS